MEKETEQFNSVNLKPISEGLGLNHFADGLPYAPTHKSRRQITRFAFPPMANEALAPPSPQGLPHASLPPTETTTAPSRAVNTAEFEPAQELRAASFHWRSLAYVIDVAVLTVAYLAIVWVAFTMNGFDLLSLLFSRAGSNLFGPLAVFFFVVYLAYFLIQETGWKTTLGKSLFGISIHAASGGGVITRSLLFFASAMPIGIGLFWALFDHERRCWHDVMTGTRLVVRTWPFED